MRQTILVLAMVVLCLGGFKTFGQDNRQDSTDSTEATETADRKVNLSYTNKGFQLSTGDQRFKLHLESRLQFRFATPGDEDPTTFNEFTSDKGTIFKVNRARLKVGGNAFEPWLKYYWEYELAAGVLLDFRVMIEKYPFLSLKVGQWKIDYSRERSVSSGKQELADRSIINRYFTLDRQMGVALYGRLNKGTVADISYWASALTGTGRGNRSNDDNHLMYVGRLQWNFFGEDLGYNSSDLTRHQKPVAYLAGAAATNRSPYTRFSTAGGGELGLLPIGEPGQYRVNQWLIESALMYKGFSWAHEFHRKTIDDLINEQVVTLGGYYLQAGYFWNEVIPWVPEKLEMAVRYAYFDPDVEAGESDLQEFTLAFNYFFNGHRNKLTAEWAHIESLNNPFEIHYNRYRIQWEISF